MAPDQFAFLFLDWELGGFESLLGCKNGGFELFPGFVPADKPKVDSVDVQVGGFEPLPGYVQDDPNVDFGTGGFELFPGFVLADKPMVDSVDVQLGFEPLPGYGDPNVDLGGFELLPGFVPAGNPKVDSVDAQVGCIGPLSGYNHYYPNVDLSDFESLPGFVLDYPTFDSNDSYKSLELDFHASQVFDSYYRLEHACY